MMIVVAGGWQPAHSLPLNQHLQHLQQQKWLLVTSMAYPQWSSISIRGILVAIVVIVVVKLQWHHVILMVFLLWNSIRKVVVAIVIVVVLITLQQAQVRVWASCTLYGWTAILSQKEMGYTNLDSTVCRITISNSSSSPLTYAPPLPPHTPYQPPL